MSAQQIADFIDIPATAEQPIDPDRGIPTWTTTEHHFGDISEGDTVSYEYVVKNTGKKPFLITGSDTDCGCTVPVYDDKPIMPGQSETVEVRFASQGRVGTVDKKISIFTNVQPHHHTLRLKGTVIASP